MRDLFIRHDRLSIDQVERLRKRVESNSMKMEGVKAVKKDRWEEEADRLIGIIEKDQATIAAQLHRRVFIRAWYVLSYPNPPKTQLDPSSMWHELRVVLHNRENAPLTQTIQAFAREEQEFSEHITANWVSLVESVENMPFE
jgi:sorting nexin-8